MAKTIGTVLLLVVVFFGALWLYDHYESQVDMQEQQAQPVPVEVATVKEASMPQQLGSLGSLSASQQATISSEIDGTITKLYFKNGDHVDKGDTIIQLDDSKTKADLSSAQAALELSKNTYARNLALFNAGGTSKQDIDRLKADVESKEADVKNAVVAYRQTSIRAPFSGVLGEFQINEGDYISSGAELIHLVNKEQLKVKYSIAERYVPELKIGQEVQVTTDAYPNKIFVGTVSFVSPTINKDTRSIPVEATIYNREGLLSPGMFVSVIQVVGTDKKSLVIPDTAISSSLQGYTVFKVVDDKVVQTVIELGDRLNGMVAVTKGLEEGDQVVVAGQQKLSDGSTISIVTPQVDLPANNDDADSSQPGDQAADDANAEQAA